MRAQELNLCAVFRSNQFISFVRSFFFFFGFVRFARSLFFSLAAFAGARDEFDYKNCVLQQLPRCQADLVIFNYATLFRYNVKIVCLARIPRWLAFFHRLFALRNNNFFLRFSFASSQIRFICVTCVCHSAFICFYFIVEMDKWCHGTGELPNLIRFGLVHIICFYSFRSSEHRTSWMLMDMKK